GTNRRVSPPQRPRVQRRLDERALRKLVQDRERLWSLSPGGSAARPLVVDSTAVIEPRARALPCPQCEGELRVGEHRAAAGGLRAVDVRCSRCHAARTVWFRLGSSQPS
ncbi:MAG TPA: hypothetical protein VHE35_26450, partial [Kofleriaceae bacterium]|nr:hypothetical protein [Kofleriaceae bacterium]